MNMYTDLNAFYAEHPEPGQESQEIQDQEVALLAALVSLKGIVRYFEFLAEVLALIESDLGMSLTEVHLVEFLPGVSGGEWWMHINEEMYAAVWMYQGKPTVSISGRYEDTVYHLNPFESPIPMEA